MAIESKLRADQRSISLQIFLLRALLAFGLFALSLALLRRVAEVPPASPAGPAPQVRAVPGVRVPVRRKTPARIVIARERDPNPDPSPERDLRKNECPPRRFGREAGV